MKLPIYFDYSATCQSIRVLLKDGSVYDDGGNFDWPLRLVHTVMAGRQKNPVDNAREQIADLLNADPRGVFHVRSYQSQITLLSRCSALLREER